MITAAPTVVRSPRATERVFYTGMAITMLLVVLAGFSRTYFLRAQFGHPPLPLLMHVHGVIFTAWLVLLIAQTALVAARRTPLHRQFGWVGAGLAASMLVVGTYTALIRARSFPVPDWIPSPLVALTIPLGDMLFFALFVGVALYYRRRLDVHKRLMLLATIAILPAATARLPFAFIEAWGPLTFFFLADALIIPMLAFDWYSRGRPHVATVVGGLLLVASHPLRLQLGFTQAWLSFAEWATRWTV